MKKRIVFLIICVLLVAQGVTMAVALASFDATYRDATLTNLEGDINTMEITLAEVDSPDFQQVADQYQKAYGYTDRITFIAPDGTVLADSSQDPATMDNHAGRPEVEQALSGGFGTDERVSDTTGEKMIYVAKKLPDGTVLRLSVPTANISAVVTRALPVMIITFIVLLVVALIVSGKLARGILAPFRQLIASVRDYLDGETPTLRIDSKFEEMEEISRAFTEVADRLNRYIKRVKRESAKSTLILDSISEGLMILDKDQDVLLANAAAREILGAGDDVTNVNILHFVRRQDVLNKIDKAFDKRKSTTFEITDDQTGKTYRWMLSMVTEDAFLKGGEGMLALITDVSETVLSEQVRRDFSANVSHELKTPLTSIDGYAQLIESGMAGDADKVKHYARRISEESARLMGLINDTLALSELDQIAIDEKTEDVDLLKAAREVEELLASKLAEKHIEMKITGSARINANKHRIGQLLTNLAENAVKYGKEGGNVEIGLSEEGGEVLVQVKDDGIGIPGSETGRVFERFYRAKNAGGATVPGTGLGLAIAKHIAQLYGGGISVVSAPGEGSTFTVRMRK